jgi:hypothetical protein
MFHRFALVAGDGKQQLYLGREAECENMARKLAGAFLDGAFYQSNIAPTPAAQAAEPVATQWLAEMIMSDCGCSTGNQRLLDRIIDRIQHYDRANTAAQPPRRQTACWRMLRHE